MVKNCTCYAIVVTFKPDVPLAEKDKLLTQLLHDVEDTTLNEAFSEFAYIDDKYDDKL